MYRTGDIARLRADGQMDYIGRTDDQVKIRGYRVEPKEIEVTLANHPAVKEAVVLVQKTVKGNMNCAHTTAHGNRSTLLHCVMIWPTPSLTT